MLTQCCCCYRLLVDHVHLSLSLQVVSRSCSLKVVLLQICQISTGYFCCYRLLVDVHLRLLLQQVINRPFSLPVVATGPTNTVMISRTNTIDVFGGKFLTSRTVNVVVVVHF